MQVDTAAPTIPSVLAGSASLHSLCRIEMTNGVVVRGRLMELDPLTLNVRIEEIGGTSVRRLAPADPPRAGGGDTRRAGKTSREEEGEATATAAAADGSSGPLVLDEEIDPLALQCVSGMVIRGAHVRYIDFISEEGAGGRDLGDILAAVSTVRPTP